MSRPWLAIPYSVAEGDEKLEKLIRLINDAGRGASGGAGGGNVTNTFSSSTTTITGSSGGPWFVLAYSGTLTVDKANGGNQRVTMTGDAALADPVGFSDGDELTLRIQQDATGGRTLTRTTPAKWELPANYTLYGLASQVITITWKFDSTGKALIKSIIES